MNSAKRQRRKSKARPTSSSAHFKNTGKSGIIFRCHPQGAPIPKGFEINRAEWFALYSSPDGLSDDQRELIEGAMARQL